MSFTIPGGTSKGTPIESASDQDLKYWIAAKRKGLKEDPNGQFAEQNKQWLIAATKELQSRSAETETKREEGSKAIQEYSGAHDDAAKATSAMQRLQQIGHLVSPSPACGTLPEGTSVVISAIMIDSANETFSLPEGMRGIGKVPLQKLAGALGLSWSPESGRLDNGSDPRFVHYRAVGYVRQFDGTLRRIVGEKIMDLRPGSPQVEALEKRAKDKFEREKNKPNAKDVTMGDWKSQIRDMCLFILEHAETKAQNRAIRSLGLRSSYSQAELQKPFFAAKLQFTGQSDDPEIRRMFAKQIAESMLGSSALMFGAPQHRAPLNQQSQPQPLETTGHEIGVSQTQQSAGYSPPPVETMRHGVDDDPSGPDGTSADYDDDFPT